MTKTRPRVLAGRRSSIVVFSGCCLLVAGALASPAMATPPLPAEVQTFIERQQDCDHWTGEEPYDQERRKEIEEAIDDLGCATIDKDEQTLRQRYKDDQAVIKALDDSAQGPL